MKSRYFIDNSNKEIERMVLLELQKHNLSFFELPAGMSREQVLYSLNKAVKQALYKEYKGYRLYEIEFKDKGEKPVYDYGVFLKPKLHFRKKLLTVDAQHMVWKEIVLRGGCYVSGLSEDVLIRKKNVIVSVCVNEEYRILFYRWR